jgi:hypothetical protein
MGEPISIPQAQPPAQGTPRRLEQVVRKALSSDPRMPIRLDRAAWKRNDPLSQDETEALVALGEAEMPRPAASAAHPSPTASMPAAAAGSSALEPSVANPAVRETFFPGASGAAPLSPSPPVASCVAGMMPGATSWRMRLLQTSLRLPAPAMAAAMLTLLVAMALCTASGRQWQREQLRQQLRVLDALPQQLLLRQEDRQTLAQDLAAYRLLVGQADPDLLRWDGRLRP